MAKYTIDIQKSGNIFRTEGFRLGDNGIRSLEFTLTDGANPLSLPENSIATLFALLPSGETIYAPCSIIGDTVTYKLSAGKDAPSLTSVPGIVKCEIRITAEDDAVITSPLFSIEVDGILQNDSAIEAHSSFSALTDALGRVLEAEKGLASKVDKVGGTEGNAIVFGADGAIVDYGFAPTVVYTLDFDGTGSKEFDEKNLETISQILEDRANGKFFVIYIDYEGDRLHAEISAEGRIMAVFSNASGYLEIRKIGSRISYTQFDNYSNTFSESGKAPATQEATAKWVKSYVDEKLLIDTEVVL